MTSLDALQGPDITYCRLPVCRRGVLIDGKLASGRLAIFRFRGDILSS